MKVYIKIRRGDINGNHDDGTIWDISYIRGDVCAVVVGDHHTDGIRTTKSGVNYIFTANSVTYYVGSPTQVPRKDGDKTEMLFDIMTVDKNSRMIHITRVGAGEDRKLSY